MKASPRIALMICALACAAGLHGAAPPDGPPGGGKSPPPPAKGKGPASPEGDTAPPPPAKGTVAVVAEGLGTTPAKALKDALRNAVQQVVGAVVDSEVQVKNDEVIREQVLTYSDGLVKSYKKLAEKRADDLFRVRIEAQVERRSVIAKLRAANVTVKKVDGAGLFAEAVTGLEAEKNAGALLANALKDYPAGCLRAELAGKPVILEKDAAKARARFTIKVSVDPKAYQAFAGRLDNTLKEIARDRGEFSLAFAENQLDKLDQGVFHPRNGDHVESVWPATVPKLFKAQGRAQPADRRVVGVALATQLNKLGDRSEWNYYLLDDACRDALWQRAYAPAEARLVLEDEDGKPVTSDRFALEHRNPRGGGGGYPANLVTCVGHHYNGSLYLLSHDVRIPEAGDPKSKRNFFLYLVSPVFWARNTNRAEYRPVLEVQRDVTLTLDELRSVQSARCVVSFGPPPE